MAKINKINKKPNKIPIEIFVLNIGKLKNEGLNAIIQIKLKYGIIVSSIKGTTILILVFMSFL